MAAMFELVVTTELKVLLYVVLYANAFRMIPEHPAHACGDDLYPRVLLTHRYLLLTVLAAAVLLLAVKSGVRAAEAAAKARARSRRLAAEAGALSRSFAAGARALDAADHVGIGPVALWLRGTLLLAVVLSFAASVLAYIIFENGIRYRMGCHADRAGYSAGAPPGVLVLGLLALLHGSFAWTAVTNN